MFPGKSPEARLPALVKAFETVENIGDFQPASGGNKNLFIPKIRPASRTKFLRSKTSLYWSLS
jgi:hypothetical protein